MWLFGWQLWATPGPDGHFLNSEIFLIKIPASFLFLQVCTQSLLPTLDLPLSTFPDPIFTLHPSISWEQEPQLCSEPCVATPPPKVSFLPSEPIANTPHNFKAQLTRAWGTSCMTALSSIYDSRLVHEQEGVEVGRALSSHRSQKDLPTMLK